jgi:indolepyruvate ferredoxin oxidoreductase
MEPPAIDLEYQLEDGVAAETGRVFLGGVEALARLLITQSSLDRARGWKTAGFASGYRGSPLGAVDTAFWRSAKRFEERGIRFLPAINEELAATAVLGTQRVESDPQRTVDGVFALWYGKGPGLDRAGDALRHGNAYGSSPRGGVIVVVGDDHGCVSSSMPHQSDFVMQGWQMPVLSPATIGEMIEFGLYGWAASRFSGAWVGLTALSEVVESSRTIELGLLARHFDVATDYAPPPGGLHYRWPDLPSLAIEERLAHKLDALRAFARANPIDRMLLDPAAADLGIITCGKAHLDLLEALRRLEVAPQDLAAAGIRWLKVGQSFPLETQRIRAFAHGLREIFVVEEKGPFVERQVRALLYRAADAPLLLGKQAADGSPHLSALGELRPSRVIGRFADWLARNRPPLDRRDRVVDFTAPPILANDVDSTPAAKRVPYFCSGCPHNTSTRVPDGSRAQGGIGCHFMASWMERETSGLIQMGGEGVDWVSHAMFTRDRHVFQNIGDGTFYHSGHLAIRQAVAAGATMTYKILYNDAVAMTGGQPVDGPISVVGVAQKLDAEGVTRIAVISEPEVHAVRDRTAFPKGTTFHERGELDAVQRVLRETAGVTALIYDQTCAAEKRRRRRKGKLEDPARRPYINRAVCEGCGDCGTASNCLSVEPVETVFGRKREINQSSCNKDYSCLNGFCPSFVTVEGGGLRKEGAARSAPQAARLAAAIDALPAPPAWSWGGPFDLLICGIGGTGVVTVGALATMAAHLEGLHASQLDFTGFAQKGGSVLCHVRLARSAQALNQVRIDTQQADAVLACDLAVAASPEALQTVKAARTRIIANLHQTPTASFVRDPDANLLASQLVDRLRFAIGPERLQGIDANRLAEDLLGDSIYANVLLMGCLWQAGLLPLELPALLRAIELNGADVAANRLAFGVGRLALAAPAELVVTAPRADAPARTLEALIEAHARHLADYQDAALAQRYRALVERVRACEAAVTGAASTKATDSLTAAVARAYGKLLAVKDEYEVARLYTDGRFEQELERRFQGDYRIRYLFAPPLVAHARTGEGAPRKISFGSWIRPLLKIMARGRRLRGTAFDVFGHTAERRLERQLIVDYERDVERVLDELEPARLATGKEIAALPESMRGFGHVKLANVALARARARELWDAWEKRERRPVRSREVPIPVVAR